MPRPPHHVSGGLRPPVQEGCVHEARARLRPEGAYSSLLRRTFGGGVQLPVLGSAAGLNFAAPEQGVVAELLDKPADDVGKAVRGSWKELTAAGTSTERAAELPGVPMPKTDPAERGLC